MLREGEQRAWRTHQLMTRLCFSLYAAPKTPAKAKKDRHEPWLARPARFGISLKCQARLSAWPRRGPHIIASWEGVSQAADEHEGGKAIEMLDGSGRSLPSVLRAIGVHAERWWWTARRVP